MANWYVTLKDGDLVHYGVLGMKWGIRRYQNKDGSLTELGRKRFSESQNKLIKENDDNSNTHQKDYIIKKGSSFYRVADPNEPVDNKRKYVTTNIDSYYNYLNDAHEYALNLKDPFNASSYKYENKYDLKVAGYDTVIDLITEINSDYDIKNEYDPFANKYITARFDKKTRMIMKYAYDSVKDKSLREIVDEEYETAKIGMSRYYKTGKNFVDDMVRERATQIYNIIKDAKNKLFDEAKSNEKILYELNKRGYDAVCDVIDAAPGYYESEALIIINPKKSLNLKEERKSDKHF